MAAEVSETPPETLPEWPGDVAPEEEVDEPSPAEEKRRLSERAIQHRAERYTELARQPDFQAFLRELTLKNERMEAQFIAEIRAGYTNVEESLSQRQIDYNRGYADGLKYPQQILTMAANLLAKIDAEAEESKPDDERT